MSTRQTGLLSAAEQAQISQLISLCRIHDGLSLSYPVEEGDMHFLFYEEDGRLASVLGLFLSWENAWEVSGFTRPDARRMGYFNALLKQALAYVEDEARRKGLEYDVLFVTQKGCSHTEATLAALHAKYDFSEYVLEKELGNEAVNVLENGAETSTPSPSLSVSMEADGACTGFLGENAVGTCLLTFQKEQVFLSHFYIEENLRRQGLGTAFLRAIFSMAAQRKARSILLQVSGTNIPAVKLYKKTGFRIREALDYYYFTSIP